MLRRMFAGASADILRQPHVHQAVQKRSGRQDDRLAAIDGAGFDLDACRAARSASGRGRFPLA